MSVRSRRNSGMPKAANRCFQLEHDCSPIPSPRMISATDVPDSACLNSNAICSSVKCFVPIRKNGPPWYCQGAENEHPGWIKKRHVFHRGRAVAEGNTIGGALC